MNIFTTDHPMISDAPYFVCPKKHPFRAFIFKTFIWSLVLTPLCFGFFWYSEATDEISPPTGEAMFPPQNLLMFLYELAPAFLFCLFFVPLLLFVSRLLMFGLRRLLRFWKQNKSPFMEPVTHDAVPFRHLVILFGLTLGFMALSYSGYWMCDFFY